MRRSYALGLEDEAGKSSKVALMGLPADDEWVLYAAGGDEADKTGGMRNYLAYNLARAEGRYAPR